MYHIYLKDGNSLSIMMYKDVELLIEPINIIDALRLALNDRYKHTRINIVKRL